MSKENKSIRMVMMVAVITAAATAVGTSLVKDWGPALYSYITSKPILMIKVVQGDGAPVQNVNISLWPWAERENDNPRFRNTTGKRGWAEFSGVPKGKIFIVAAYLEGQSNRTISDEINVDTFPKEHVLKNFERWKVDLIQVAMETRKSQITAITPSSTDLIKGKEEASKVGTAKWMDIAFAELGVKEIPGPEHNPRIIEYHSATTLMAKDDETPWPSSFVNWVMKQAGIEGTADPSAASWLKWGREIPEPVFGAITVLQLRTNNPWKASMVGFYVGSEGENKVKVLGGNINNQVRVAAYPANRVVSYRLPASY